MQPSLQLSLQLSFSSAIELRSWTTNLDARVESEAAAAPFGLPPLAGGGGGHDGQRQRRHGDGLQKESGINPCKCLIDAIYRARLKGFGQVA